MFSKICVLTLITLSLTAGLLHAEETNPVLGKVGDFIIREADLDRLIANQPAAVQKRIQEDPQQKIAIVREILMKKVVVAKARKDGYDRKPDIKEQLGYVIDNFIAQEYLTKVVAAGVTVPEEELKKFYQEYEKEFVLPEQVKVRHILVAVDKTASAEEKEKARIKAETVLLRIRKGDDFAKLAGEVSEDQNSAAQGGELAPFTSGKTNSTEFEQAAFALKNDEISPVVATTYGFHIIKMIEHREKRTAPYADVRDLILNKLKADREQGRVEEFVEKAAKEAGMVVYGEEKAVAPENSDKKTVGETPDASKKINPATATPDAVK